MFPPFKNSQCNCMMENHHSRASTDVADKPFHLERQTFYHNNFKKIKPAEFLLKQYQNRSSTNLRNSKITSPWCPRNSQIKILKQKTLQSMLKTQKGLFQHSINQNLLQVNRSFNRYIYDKTSEQQKITNQRKKTLSCKNLLKELQHIPSFKKNNPNSVNLHQKNLLQMAADTNYQITNMESNCLDTMFPFERYGPALSSYQGQLLLYGGFASNKKSLTSCFHKYNIEKKLWSRVQQVSKPSSIIPCYHTIDVYRNYMILVGGMSITPQNGMRRYNSDVCIYNFDKKEWLKLRTTLTIRSHATTLFGNTLLVHGGLDDRENNSNQMHFINFNPSSIQNSIILSTYNRQAPNTTYQHSLSHHKLVNSNEVDPNLKMLLKFDGVFCFGGVNHEGEMNNQITFLNCIGKQNSLDVRFQTWVRVQVNAKSPKPQPRKNHTFTIINKKALILLIGGQGILGQILKDMWVFDLIKLQWKQINPIPNPINEIITQNPNMKQSKIQDGIAGHCVTIIGSKLYIFGGRKSASSKKQHCLWSIETDMVNGYVKKVKFEKSSTSSANTIKDSNKQESMWDIEF